MLLADDDDSVLLYSRPNTPNVRNIIAHSNVALTFNSDSLGKYGESIVRLGMTPKSNVDDYSVAIRLHVTRLRGF